MNVYYLIPVLFIMFALPWCLRFVWPHKISWVEMGASALISMALAAMVMIAGTHSVMSDVEILNGQVVSKERTHGTYTVTYSCNCHSVGSGKSRRTVCQTCRTRHYTVSWDCDTTIGKFNIDSRDSTFPTVYATSDPVRYVSVQKDDPVSKTHSYDNYVKAVPDSLFHQIDVKKYEQNIPPYPDQIYDIYRINRAVSVGVPVPDIRAWNDDISNMLRTLGSRKQVNVVVVFTNIADQSYQNAIEGKWLGGKKNDVVVIFGTSAYPKIDWVGVLSWTDNQLFKVELRDDLYNLGNIDRQQAMKIIAEDIEARYIRKPMADFDYLKERIEPPMWVIILSLVIGLIAIGGTTYWFYKENPFERLNNGR